MSLLSALIALAAWNINRQKLRLDLYNRRFDVYSRVLDFYHEFEEWKPNESEKAALQTSPDLLNKQRAFIKATREAQFLFDAHSQVHKRLEQMHKDFTAVIQFRLVAGNFSPSDPSNLISEHKKHTDSLQRIHEAFPLLEKGMSKYLNFHKL